MIQNLAQLLQPFLPFGCAQIEQMLGITLNKWCETAALATYLTDVTPLYERIDVAKMDEELQALQAASKV